ncbi:hypothetical protein RhiirA4_476881 [Rhizophagus irregularis]|uniref:Uncharacterized protein n=1 Tax=Rhizophagus irregularis TaxID=588596 RepID=A0A2I1HCA5_9GLOM|nr:hypothetical protein RhiirA4_476881 [Rhizophagus irregularis]
MRKSCLSSAKPFSLRESVDNNEGNEMELQDKMGDKCNNNFRGKDDDNDDSGKEMMRIMITTNVDDVDEDEMEDDYDM